MSCLLRNSKTPFLRNKSPMELVHFRSFSVIQPKIDTQVGEREARFKDAGYSED